MAKATSLPEAQPSRGFPQRGHHTGGKAETPSPQRPHKLEAEGRNAPGTGAPGLRAPRNGAPANETHQQFRLRPSPLLVVLCWAAFLATWLPLASSQRIPAQQAAVLTSCLRTWGLSLPGWGPPWDCAAAAGLACDEAGLVTELTLRAALPSPLTKRRRTRSSVVRGGRSGVSSAGGDVSDGYGSRRVGREGRLLIPRSLGGLSSLTKLDLSSSGFSGGIPPSLSGLLSLRVLNLSSSSFSGPIPSLLGNLTLLSSLDLSSNAFSGPLPQNLGKLKNLIILDVSFNQLSSALPDSLGNLSAALASLDASGNSLSGTLPGWISRLTALTALRLSANAFSGPLPPSLGALRSLKTLSLHSNRLSGPIPDNISGLTGLSTLRLSQNFLSGPIPGSISGLRGLCYLSLYENQLSGSIPDASLGSLRNLSSINLRGNFLEGGFPSGLTSLTGLCRLDLSQNLLNGTTVLPLAPLGLTTLTFLSLANNSFAGGVPASLWDLTLLRHLSLSGNALSGPLPPPGIGTLQHLTFLDLSGNPQLSAAGALAEAAAIPGLRALDLSGAHVSGPLPARLSLLTLLTSLSLAGTGLSGPIGATLASLGRLQFLDLSRNLLQGPIPGSLRELTRLTALSLASNRLSGGVPEDLCTLSGLRVLDLARNSLGAGERAKGGRWQSASGSGADSDALPACLGSNLQLLETLSLAHNKLSGSIPGPVFAIRGLQSLDLSGNLLGGPVPRLQEASRKLHTLALGANRLEGPIPESLSRATGLQVLDLSRNRLTGGVPPFLASSLPLLRDLSLGDNLLEGNATGVVGALGASLPFLERLDLSLGSLNGALPASPPLSATAGGAFARLSFLNLSAATGLAGGVPPWVSALSSLAVLDLQGTGVAGALPTTLALLSSLNTLRLPATASCPNEPCGTPQAAWDGALCAICPEFCASCPEPLPPPQPAVAALLAFQRASGIPGTWTVASQEGVETEDGAVTSISLVNLGRAGGAPLPSFRLQFEALAQAVGGTLTRLTLSGCAVTGPIPSSLGLLTGLRALDASRNAISGDLPGTFRNLTRLTSLDLSHQSTPSNPSPLSPSSSSPSSSHGRGLGGARILSPLTSLESLSLAYSGYTGSFPHELSALTSLRALDLSGNPGLMGGVPPEVGGMRQLTFLGLHATGVRARMPASLASLPLRFLISDQGSLQCPGTRTPCPAEPVHLSSPLCTKYCPSFCARCPSINATPLLVPPTAVGSGTASLLNQTAGGPGFEVGAPSVDVGPQGISLGAAETAAIVSGTAAGFFAVLLCAACIAKACLRGGETAVLPGFRFGPGGGGKGKNVLRRFSFRELVQATASFSSRLFLDTPGRYRGQLESGQLVAVHNLDTKTTRGTPRGKMQAHVRKLAAIQHPNLVPLLGYCQDADHILFVYEIVPRATLRSLLAHEPSVLTWERRVRISLGIALGLDHLHSAVTPPLVHLGLTSSEVIITGKYEAKIGSFGQSGFRLDASRVKGARAYVDPSYLETGVEDPMNDVYSLGVLLLELATGLDAFKDQQHLVQRVQQVLDSDVRSVEIMAPQLRKELVTESSSWGSVGTGSGSSSVLGTVSGSVSGAATVAAGAGAGTGGGAPPFSPPRSYTASVSSMAGVLTPALFRRFLVVASACCSLDPRHRPTMRLLAAQLEEIQAGNLANPGNTKDSARFGGPLGGSDSISTSGSRTSS